MKKKTSNSIVDPELCGKIKNEKIPNFELTDKIKDHMDYIPKNDSEDLNPRYLFQGIATDLLVAIVNNQIDLVELAYRELEN